MADDVAVVFAATAAVAVVSVTLVLLLLLMLLLLLFLLLLLLLCCLIHFFPWYYQPGNLWYEDSKHKQAFMFIHSPPTFRKYFTRSMLIISSQFLLNISKERFEETFPSTRYALDPLIFYTPIMTILILYKTQRYFYITLSAYREHLCILCGSQYKHRLFPSAALTDWLP